MVGLLPRLGNMARLAIYAPEITPSDARAAADAVASGWVADGPALEAFERAWARRTQMPHAMAVSNGTAALELAVRALGIGPGDEVLCPSFAIVSCVRAVVLAGAAAILVDAEPRTFNIDPAAIEAHIGPRTRAILAVHTYGHPFDPALPGIARRRGLSLIEDAAEAPGAELEVDGQVRPCGGIGDVSIFQLLREQASHHGGRGDGRRTRRPCRRARPFHEESVLRRGPRSLSARGVGRQLPHEQRRRRHRLVAAHAPR